jgi:hypothetical protein
MADAESLQQEIAQLKARIGVLEDIHAIRSLQFKYGYYMDKCLYDDVVDLFADNGEVHFAGGIYRGKPGVRRLYIDRFRAIFAGGRNGPVHGFLVDVAPDRKTAFGRFRAFMQAGSHVTKEGPVVPPGLQQWWEAGIYENTYVSDRGTWKIKVLNYNLTFHGTYEKGWAYWDRADMAPATETYPADPLGPDALTDSPKSWPHTSVVPFHYPHPVTGKPWTG